jgi:hypothetical protein
MLNSKLLTAAVIALSLSFGAVFSIASALEPGKPTSQPETGMMGGQPGMMGNRGGMMGMMNAVDPGQMKRMVENCNRMMESMMQTAPDALPNTPEKKG